MAHVENDLCAYLSHKELDVHVDVPCIPFNCSSGCLLMAIFVKSHAVAPTARFPPFYHHSSHIPAAASLSNVVRWHIASCRPRESFRGLNTFDTLISVSRERRSAHRENTHEYVSVRDIRRNDLCTDRSCRSRVRSWMPMLMCRAYFFIVPRGACKCRSS